MKHIKLLLASIITLFVTVDVQAIERWTSSPSKVDVIFPQGKRENPNHAHSEKILLSLENMSGIPAGCRSDYVYLNKDDTHLYSLILAAHMSQKNIRIAATDQGKLTDICRVVMVASPNYLQ